MCPCLDVGLFMSYLCNLFFILIIISLRLIVKSHEYRHICYFAYFLEYALLFLDDNVHVECE